MKVLLVPLVPLAALGIVELAHGSLPAPVAICVQPQVPQRDTPPPSQPVPEHPGPQPKLSL